MFCCKCGVKTSGRDMDEKENSAIAREQSANPIKPYYREQFERIALFIVELISIIGSLNFNLTLLAISSVLSIMNGFKFNK